MRATTVSRNGHQVESAVVDTASKAAKKTSQKVVVHDVPRPEIVNIKIKGVTPFLSHKKAHDLSELWENKLMGKGKKKTVIDPEAMWEASIYRHPTSNKPCVLGRALKSSIVEAAQKYWEKGTWSRVNGSVFVTEEFIPLAYKKMSKRRDFLPLRGSGATNSYRVEFFDWAVTIPIRYDAGYINLDQIVNLISRAGFSIGVGDDRPGKGKGGTHGMWEVDA